MRRWAFRRPNLAAMRRFLPLMVALFLAAPASLAMAAIPDDAVDDLRTAGYFVEPGARSIDGTALEGVLRAARNEGSRLMEAILDEDPSGGPVAFADAVLDDIGDGTVIVLTRSDDVGVASTEYAQTETEGALDVADARGGDDLNYVTSFTAALVFGVEAIPDAPIDAPVTTAPAAQGDGGGGSGGLIILLVIVGVLVLIVVFVVRSSNKKARERRERDIATARTEIKAQLDAMANDILDLADRVQVNDAAGDHYQAASATYTEATEQFEKAGTLEDLERLAEQVGEATWQLDAAEALLEGEPVPDKPKPRDNRRCFFDPTHSGPFEDAELQTTAGNRTVRVCRPDAEKLRRGESPQPRMVEVGGRRMPSASAPRSHGGGGLGGLDWFSILVGGMSSGLPQQWGSGSSRTSSASRRSGPGGGLFGGSSRRTSSASRTSSRRSSSTTRRSSSSRPSSGRSRTGRRRRR